MSDRAEVKLTILEAVVKGYHELVLFLLHLMNCCDIESLAYIACVLQQLLQTPLSVLIEIYFEVIRTLLALAVTILYTLYTVACVQIQLQWSFSSYLSEALATTV